MRRVIPLWTFMLAMFGTALANEKSAETGLLITELTIEKGIGCAGSWLEITNMGPRDVDLKNHDIVVNGSRIRLTKQSTTLYSEGILLVRFSATVSNDLKKLGEKLDLLNTGELQLKAPSPALKGRKPGYCALTEVGLKGSTLLDYVEWGNGKLSNEYEKMAIKKGIWLGGEDRDGAVYLGLDQAPGDPIVPEGESVLYRVNFKHLKNDRLSWILLETEYSTPGKGNPLPYPRFLDVENGVNFPIDSPLSFIMWWPCEDADLKREAEEAVGDGDKPNHKHRKKSFRLQVQRSPWPGSA